MDEDQSRPVAYIAIHGIQKERSSVSQFVPCGFGVVILSGYGQQRFRGAAFYKDPQDAFADAIIQTINELGSHAAEDAGDPCLKSVDFLLLSAGFTKKFGQALDANQAGGLAKSGKPYNSYRLWNEATALKALSGSTFSTIRDSKDAVLLYSADYLGVEGAEIAAQNMGYAKSGVFRLDEIDVFDVEEFMEENERP